MTGTAFISKVCMYAADTQQTKSCQNIVYILLYVTIVYVTLMLYGCLDMIIAFV